MVKKTTVLITGGAGFIGHHLAPYLKDKGHEVICLDSFHHHITNPKYKEFINSRLKILKEHDITLEKGDNRDPEFMQNILKRHNPDTIVHLAATASAGLCNLDPSEGIDMGLISFCGTLNAVRRNGKPIHVIYSSSSMIYGNFEKPIVYEDDHPKPINVYGASKVSCETFMKCYGKVYKIPYTIIRPSALYGPRCINRRITQVFIENIMASKKIKISGKGESMLDFTDVRDLSRGINLIIENPGKSKDRIFNITYGSARPIKDLLPVLKKELGDFECEYVPKDPNVPKRGTLCVDKIKNIIGYKPEYPLEKGYRDLIGWYKSIKWK